MTDAPSPAPLPASQPSSPPALAQSDAEPDLPPASLEGQEQALRTLLLAQRTADEAIREAQAEADKIIADAQGRAANVDNEIAARISVAMGGLLISSLVSSSRSRPSGWLQAKARTCRVTV